MRRFIPEAIFSFFQPFYHFTFALLGALLYGFPSRKLTVIGVTGTKGKSSTTEILNAILEEAGYKTAVSNTIRFKIGEKSSENLYKMSMPGRFFMQKFLYYAHKSGCDYAILEMTSQGSILHRHRFIDLDTFVFTNISPEHIEAHGSYEKYLQAKLDLASSLSTSKKKNRTLIVNADDGEAAKFLRCAGDKKIMFSIKDIEPYKIERDSIYFNLGGQTAHSPLNGIFNLYNLLAAATAARAHGVSDEIIIRAIEKFSQIPGRFQKIEEGQPFTVIVDYAHTPDSLKKLYGAISAPKKICVLGGTGGGRDTWKRGEMGRIADEYCKEVIVTNEDPYDEDPQKIIDDVASGVTAKIPRKILDRREAIQSALKLAQPGDAILITGKGTDPYIMGPNDTKISWNDAQVVREELRKL